ncbi:protein kinase, partial [Cryomyces antarcticus]
TARTEKDYFSAKTPCRQGSGKTPVISETEDVELWSSPFPEVDVKAASDVVKVSQPLLTKTTKDPLAPKTAKAKPVGKEIVPRGPIIKETICNPVDEQTRQTILENIQPPLSQYDGYYKQSSRDYGKSVEIHKFTKAMAKVTKNGNEKTATNLAMPPILRFEGADKEYTVKRELGKGAYAPVYLVEGTSAEEEECDDCDDEPVRMGKGRFGLKRHRLEAIKMEDPPTAWEFYIMRQAKRRLGVSRAAESVIHAYEMHIFRDEGYLIEEFRDQGTLLDLVNIARADINGGGVMDEQVVMFFAVELLRTVEALHAKGLIHGDLKADNVLVRFDVPPSDTTWSAQYARDGTNGWAAKGLALIDFGRGIDMKA